MHVEDGVQSPLEMLPVLSRDRMGRAARRASSSKRGFVREGDIGTRTEADGIE